MVRGKPLQSVCCSRTLGQASTHRRMSSDFVVGKFAHCLLFNRYGFQSAFLLAPPSLSCWSILNCITLANDQVVFQRMNVVVKPGLPMLIAGSCSPCVMLSVSAIGVTDTADKNKEHSAKIFEFLTRELGLTEDRWAHCWACTDLHSRNTALSSATFYS